LGARIQTGGLMIRIKSRTCSAASVRRLDFFDISGSKEHCR